MENSKIAIVSGMFLLVAIGAFLIIPMSEERTIILTNGNGDCTGNCGVQKLSDLTDVTIVSVINGQILQYDSMSQKWKNVNQSSFTDTTVCTNVGSGKWIIQNSTDGNCNIKTLIAGTGISLSNSSTTITITNSLPEQGCSSAGGTSIIKTTSTCDFKGLTVTSPIELTSNTNDLNIACSTCVTETVTPLYNYQSVMATGSSANWRIGTGTVYYTLQGSYNSASDGGRSATESDMQGIINKNIHVKQIDIRIRESSSNSGTFTFAFRDDSNDVCNFTLTNNSVGIQSNTCNTAVSAGSLVNFRVTAGTVGTFSPTTFVVWYTID